MKTIEDSEDLWGYTKRLRFVADAIAHAFPKRSTSEIRLLDVGCGTGSQLGIPLAGLGYELFGIDLHRESIDEARRLADGLMNARFECLAIEDLDDEFDVVILSEVLEHVETPEKLLDAALARLGKHGLLIVTVPNGYGPFEWDSWLFRSLKLERAVDKIYEWRHGQPPPAPVGGTENHENGHVQFFTRKRLLTMFAAHQLEIIEQDSSCLACGPIVGHTAARIPGFISWNARVATALPPALVSGWYFALRRRDATQ